MLTKHKKEIKGGGVHLEGEVIMGAVGTMVVAVIIVIELAICMTVHVPAVDIGFVGQCVDQIRNN